LGIGNLNFISYTKLQLLPIIISMYTFFSDLPRDTITNEVIAEDVS